MTMLSKATADRICNWLECVETEHQLEFHDDSFDHEFGTEQIYYYYCPHCDLQFDASEVDDSEDYEYND